MSNCIMSKAHVITKIFCWAEHTDTLNTWRKRFTTIIIILCIDNNVLLILNFFQLPGIDTNLFKTLLSAPCSQWKMVSIKFRKTFQERRLPIGAIQKVRTLSTGEGGTQKAYKSVQGEGGGHTGMYVRSQSSKYKIFLLCITLSFPLIFVL